MYSMSLAATCMSVTSASAGSSACAWSTHACQELSVIQIERAHQKTCKANHNATVQATRVTGTVSAPSLRNSRVSTSSS